MKTNAYWKRRMEMLEEAQMNKGERYLQDLDRQFRISQRNIENEISRWYQRFADNNQISMSEARKLLNSRQLAEFKWDVMEYIKYGEENALDPRWMKELENASALVHISRLEALKLQTQQQLEVLYGNQMDDTDKLMRTIYQDGYYHTAFEIQKGFNLGWDLHKINANELDKILSKPWSLDGKTFSDRIWTNKQQLIGKLQTHLTQSVITGKAPDKVIKNIAMLLGTYDEKPRAALYQAGRLVMTESAAFASAAQKDAFSALDVEKYEIVATLDNSTSDICRDLDGEVFEMKDYQVGTTAPPFHAWCRTVTAPYFDEFSFGQRAARDADGQLYYVPSDMKYHEWKKTFVDGGNKGGLGDIIIDTNDTDRFKEAYANWDKKKRTDLAKVLLQGEGLNMPVRTEKSKAFGYCSLDDNNGSAIITGYVLKSDDARPFEYQVKTLFHELYHAKVHDLVWDEEDLGLKAWAYVDDVFAESTSHYMSKAVGITTEIAPSYSQHLIEALPKLKKLDEFKYCNSISDFGGVAYKYRFSSDLSDLRAEWTDLSNYLTTEKLDLVDYSKQYLDYIKANTEELVDLQLTNLPGFETYRNNMVQDAKDGISAIESGQYPTGNAKTIFDNVLLLAMNRMGVK